MNNTTCNSIITIVMGDVTGWYSRSVLRSIRPITVTFDASGSFGRLRIGGQEYTGAVVTPTGRKEPVIYLGSSTPEELLPEHQDWVPADMPVAVTDDRVQVDVFAVSGEDQSLFYSKTLWLPRAYRPMERLQMTLSSPFESVRNAEVRVLESAALMCHDHASPFMIVAADDLQEFADAGWKAEPQAAMVAEHFGKLERLSRCIQTRAHAVLNSAIVSDVEVHHFEAMPVESLRLLPRDVRYALERHLMALPD